MTACTSVLITRVAPFALVRVAGAPAASLDVLRLPATVAAIGETLRLDAELAFLAPDIEHALHALVPLAPSVTTRRALLAVRRAVHNGRAPHTDDVAKIAELTPDLVAPLSAWVTTAAARETAMRLGEASCTAELEGCGEQMVAALRDPELLLGLALAAPSFTAQLLRRERGANEPEHRFARTCTAYLTRAAVKTSPFSSLTTVTMCALATGTGKREPEDERAPTRVLTTSRLVAVELLAALAVHPRLAGGLTFDPIRPIGASGDGRLLLSRYSMIGHFAWRHEKAVRATAASDTLGYTGDAPGAPLDLPTVGRPRPARPRLVATGLLRPIAPWPRDAADPLERLAATVATGTPGTDRDVVDVLQTLSNTAREAGATDLPTRLAALTALPRRADEAFRSLGRPAPTWIRSHCLVEEDVHTSVHIPPLSSAAIADVEKLADLIGRTVVRRQLYDRLRDFFVARHGTGGSCRDVAAFLFDFVERTDIASVHADSAAADLARLTTPEGGFPAGGDREPVGPGMLSPAASMTYQLAAGGADRSRDEEHLLVLNQCQNGVGGILSRFLRVPGDDRSQDSLRQWISDLVPDAQPLEVPVSADCNTLQAGGGLFPRLRWPGELPMQDLGDQHTHLGSLSLTDDAATETLVLVSARGTPVVPVYLGTVPQHLVHGALGLLLLIGDPWLVGLRPSAGEGSSHLRQAPTDEIDFTQRWQDGRVVLRRATWRLPAASFPRRQPSESTFSLLRRTERWRRGHNLPSEVFVSIDRERISLVARERKPVWLAFDSPHALAVAGRLVDDAAVSVTLTEALPGRSDTWIAGSSHGGGHVSELISLCSWSARRPR